MNTQVDWVTCARVAIGLSVAAWAVTAFIGWVAALIANTLGLL